MFLEDFSGRFFPHKQKSKNPATKSTQELWQLKFRVPQNECGKRSSITFFHFWDAFVHFSVTFSDAFVTFFVTFLPDSFCGRVINIKIRTKFVLPKKRKAGDHYSANRNSGRGLSDSGQEMCTSHFVA